MQECRLWVENRPSACREWWKADLGRASVGAVRQFATFACLMVSACAAVPTTGALLPNRTIIERIERGHALLEILETVGVYDSAEMNANARVRIKHLQCSQTAANAAICTFEADRCLEDEHAGREGWCARTRKFIRTSEPDYPGVSKGWMVDKASQ